MDREIAKSILDLMFEYGGKLNDSMLMAREKCDEAEFTTYRRAVGNVLASTFENIVDPILAEHPDLRPETLKMEGTE